MKKYITWFLLCSIPFFIFFLQYPLQHSLTGDLDTIANLAMYKELKYWLQCQFTFEPYSSVCFPVKNAWLFFGADFGIGIIHVLLNYLGFNDLWAHYLFISCLFSLNAVSLFLLTKKLFGSNLVALLGSIIFNFLHFTLANLENPNTLVFFFSFISVYYLLKHYQEKNNQNKFLLYSIVFGAIQIYFSPYNFLFHAIIISCFILYLDLKKLFSLKYLIVGVTYLLIISPYIFIFILGNSIDNSYNVVGQGNTIVGLSLGLDDLYRVLPNHLYLQHETLNAYPWLYKIKSAYLGLFFYLIVILGLFKFKIEHKKLYISLIILGFVIALGPFISYKFQKLCPSLMYPLYEYFGFVDILRIPLRAFFISLLGFIFIFCGVLTQLERQHNKIAIYLVFFIVLIENIPYKMEVYNHKDLLSPQTEFLETLNNLDPNVVLNLPSDLFNYKADQREYYYMYWHHKYECNIINGSLGFIPIERMNTYKILKENEADDILQLSIDYNIDCIVFHKNMIYTEAEQKLLKDMLSDSERLEVIFESDERILFRSI